MSISKRDKRYKMDISWFERGGKRVIIPVLPAISCVVKRTQTASISAPNPHKARRGMYEAYKRTLEKNKDYISGTLELGFCPSSGRKPAIKRLDEKSA